MIHIVLMSHIVLMIHIVSSSVWFYLRDNKVYNSLSLHTRQRPNSEIV